MSDAPEAVHCRSEYADCNAAKSSALQHGMRRVEGMHLAICPAMGFLLVR